MALTKLYEVLHLLLTHDALKSTQIAQMTGVSQRTVFRYLDALTLCGVPIYTARGRSTGKVCIDKNYRLPRAFFTQAEKDLILNLLKKSQNENAKSAITKLSITN